MRGTHPGQGGRTATYTLHLHISRSSECSILPIWLKLSPKKRRRLPLKRTHSSVFPHFPKTPLTLAIYSLSGYPMGATWDPPLSNPPPLETPHVSGFRWWVEAASSLSKLVKGVSHQVGLLHICVSTPGRVTKPVGSLTFSLLIDTSLSDPFAICLICIFWDSHACQCFSCLKITFFSSLIRLKLPGQLLFSWTGWNLSCLQLFRSWHRLPGLWAAPSPSMLHYFQPSCCKCASL